MVRIPVAIRKPGGKWHREEISVMNMRCRWRHNANYSAAMKEKTPVIETQKDDRCGICWLGQRW